MNEEQRPITYASAGVDTAAGDMAVELMKGAVAATHGPEVLGGIGAFAGMFDASALKAYERPLLASSTDGVGTKVALAQAMNVHDTIGQDLVAMVVDDIVVCGAKPLAMTDYIACGKVVPQKIADIVRGIAEGCQLAGCALVGGETAEHPGLLGEEDYDVAGAAFGVVEAKKALGPEKVQAGDLVVGMDASGLHSNGYSLVRAVIAANNLRLTQPVPELSKTLGEELLTPTRIYAKDMVALFESEFGGAVHALSHITGGGLAANLARVIPAGLRAEVERGTWSPHPIFKLIADWGRVAQTNLEATLNLGIGMAAFVDPSQAEPVLEFLNKRGLPSRIIGEVFDASEPKSPFNPLLEFETAGNAASMASGPETVTDVNDPLEVRVHGAKGVEGGEVIVRGQYQGW